MTAAVVQALDGKWAVVRSGEPIPETGRYATNARCMACGPGGSRIVAPRKPLPQRAQRLYMIFTG